MAKLNLLSGPLPPRRSYGVVNTTLAGNAVARGYSNPVLPRTPAQAGGTITVAQLAAVWQTLTPTQQAAWHPNPMSPGTAYGNFFAYNQQLTTWGYEPFTAVPAALINLSPSLYFVTSEPDGVHTTLSCFGLNTGGGPNESWVQVYFDVSTLSGVPPINDNGNVYIGKFGPNPPSVETKYDITDIWTSLVGQWVFPATFDTTAGKSCGGNLYGKTADTNQFGQIYDLIFQANPSAQYFLGLQGGVSGPAACFGQPLHP